MEIVDKDSQQVYDDIQQWMADNYIMLTEWLTNVITIKEVEAKQTPSIFQTFVVPILNQPPIGLLDAGNELKHILLLASVFGMAVPPEPVRECAAISSAQVGDYTRPGHMSGFKQQVGRLPMEGDVVLFTATKWFEVSFQRSPLLLAGGGKDRVGHSTLESVCTVDCIPKEVGQI